MLVVQVVEILWTKATRGAPRSNERVALSRAFAIAGDKGEYVIQRHRMAEWESFRPNIVKAETKPSVPGSEESLRIARGELGSFTLGLLGTPHDGQPKRPGLPKAIELKPGQYVRLTVNARHTNYSGQYYSETVYNIACGEEVMPDRFLSGPPDHDLDFKANLF
jgi:hypothetical protein